MQEGDKQLLIEAYDTITTSIDALERAGVNWEPFHRALWLFLQESWWFRDYLLWVEAGRPK